MKLFGKKNKLIETVQPYLTRLYRLGYRLTGNQVDAEDLVQELMLKLHERDYKVAELEHPGAWLSKVMYRLYLDNRRKQQRNPLFLIEDINPEEEDEQVQDAWTNNLSLENYIEQSQSLKRLENGLNMLPEHQRILITLRDVEGYSLDEMQAILDLPMGTLKSRLHRARGKLTKFVKNDGTSVEKPALVEVGGQQ